CTRQTCPDALSHAATIAYIRARRAPAAPRLSVGALRIGGSIGSDGARRLLCCAHLLLGGAHGRYRALGLSSPFDLGGPSRFLGRAHGFLRRARSLARPLGFDRPIRSGLLLRAKLGLRDLARFIGSVSSLFGRALC